jgi:hypothetical protein
VSKAAKCCGRVADGVASGGNDILGLEGEALLTLRSRVSNVVMKVYEGSGIVKKKIEGEQGERMARMESDLKQWAEEDRLAKEAKDAKKD